MESMEEQELGPAELTQSIEAGVLKFKKKKIILNLKVCSLQEPVAHWRLSWVNADISKRMSSLKSQRNPAGLVLPCKIGSALNYKTLQGKCNHLLHHI